VELLHDTGVNLLVQTVYIPGIVEESEIEQIAKFLSSIDRGIKYRINPFAPAFAYERVSRRPTIEEMENAYRIASRYLENAIISRSCYREFPTPPPQETWITVYPDPDLTIRRRTMRDQEEDRISWLAQTKGIRREEILQALERARDEPSYQSELEQLIASRSGISTKRNKA